MKLFTCQVCHTLLYFENTVCGICNHRLGYLPESETLSVLQPTASGFTALAAGGTAVKFCQNADHGSCNWMLDMLSDESLCRACRHNLTIPDLSVPDNLAYWRKLELSKHRLFYALIRFGLPTPTVGEDNEPLVFEFLADPPDHTKPRVMTGHDNGRITIALKEADDAQRMALRQAMGEPFRNLMGHFRHEIGHYYWDKLVRDAGRLAECRELFGDDSSDYEEALKRHYSDGAPSGWRENFISTYATTHPWEDFAETWAHYFHIVDTLETAGSFGLQVRPRIATDNADLATSIPFNSYHAPNAERLIDEWLPLGYAVNSINRSMGQEDLYPFVISPPVVRKLQFVHDLIHQGQKSN